MIDGELGPLVMPSCPSCLIRPLAWEQNSP